MTYRILADLLVVFHLGFLLFVGLGGILAFWRRWMAWIHIPAAVWGVLIELGGWVCPLTPLENRFRRMGGEAGYAGSFIEHYLVPVLYPQGLTRGHQIGIGILVCLFNLVVYGIVLRRIRDDR
jgi:hypothetical protein